MFELFRPRKGVTALLDELRQNPATSAIHNGVPQPQSPAIDEPDTGPLSAETRTRPSERSPAEEDSDVHTMVVDYTNGKAQEETAGNYSLHIQTVRKRLKTAGVVKRSRGNALTEQDLDETRGLLDAGLSVREIGRKLGVANTTIVRAIRRADVAPQSENHRDTPRDR